MSLDQKKIARYDAQALRDIQQEEHNHITRIKEDSSIKQWCVRAGIDFKLFNSSWRGVAEFRTSTFEDGGRLNDGELSDLRKKLKKAPFKYTIEGVK